MFNKETIFELEQLGGKYTNKTPDLLKQILKDYNIFDIEGHEYSGTDFDLAVGYRGYQIMPKDFDIGYGFLFTITIDDRVKIGYDGFYDTNHRHYKAEVFKLKVINKVTELLETNQTFTQKLIDCVQQQKAIEERNTHMNYLIQHFTDAINSFKLECEVDKIFEAKRAKVDSDNGVWVEKFGGNDTVLVDEFNFVKNPSGTFTINCMKNGDVRTSSSRAKDIDLNKIMYKFASRLVEEN